MLYFLTWLPAISLYDLLPKTKVRQCCGLAVAAVAHDCGWMRCLSVESFPIVWIMDKICSAVPRLPPCFDKTESKENRDCIAEGTKGQIMSLEPICCVTSNRLAARGTIRSAPAAGLWWINCYTWPTSSSVWGSTAVQTSQRNYIKTQTDVWYSHKTHILTAPTTAKAVSTLHRLDSVFCTTEMFTPLIFRVYLPNLSLN